MSDLETSYTWTFPNLGDVNQINDHGIGGVHEGKPMFSFRLVSAKRPNFELYNTVEHALVALIAAKYTGERGAGGTGVGTAADWFMQMIGAERLSQVRERDAAVELTTAINAAEGFPPVPMHELGRRIINALESKGYVIAKQP